MNKATPNNSWLMRQVELALRTGLTRAYDTIKVNPEQFLFHLQSAHELPIKSYEGLFTVPMDRLDEVAQQTIRAGMKVAAAEGAGLGLGGIVTIVPDLGILAAITMRTLQKLSLVYGFRFTTDEEVAELWIAAASAAGVDIGRELLEKEVINRFVPKVIERIAVSASTEFVEKWTARMIPIVSSGVGAALNYYFVRAWGNRALVHFHRRHLDFRARQGTILLPPSTVQRPARADERF